MAQERPRQLIEWYLAAKAWVPTVPKHLKAWLETVRAEPSLIWKTAAVRYTTYTVAGLMLFFVVSSLPTWIVGPPPVDAQPPADTADFHVVCTNPACAAHFVVRRDKDFDSFPVQCLVCQQKSAAQAIRCMSDTCRGRWVAPSPSGDSKVCPRCGRPLTSP